jgi:RND superfamily putative drug exporter
VALGDIGGSARSEAGATVGELLVERLELTQPWYRTFTTARRAQRWIERMNKALHPSTRIEASSALMALPQLERAVALAAIVLAEGTPVVMLDQLDPFVNPEDEETFVRIVRELAAPTTTVVIGSPLPARRAPGDHIAIDLYSLSTEGLLR